MAPMVETFHPARLQQHAQYLPNGKARKPSVELKDCDLKELIQYECNLSGPRESPRSKIVCEPILKLFRQYVSRTGRPSIRADVEVQTEADGVQVCEWIDGGDDELGGSSR
ncbi:hypothetical protein D0860_06589 [Hortaea werneckii]|uniref:Uncharacterized protein n=1 Tax=Hortaea werneckii TaxID=91943 RepID=A0A3M7GT22_HORWE|nr:hypothetical protein D0860_06589 [Hortaea werneckii]